EICGLAEIGLLLFRGSINMPLLAELGLVVRGFYKHVAPDGALRKHVAPDEAFAVTSAARSAARAIHEHRWSANSPRSASKAPPRRLRMVAVPRGRRPHRPSSDRHGS